MSFFAGPVTVIRTDIDLDGGSTLLMSITGGPLSTDAITTLIDSVRIGTDEAARLGRTRYDAAYTATENVGRVMRRRIYVSTVAAQTSDAELLGGHGAPVDTEPVMRDSDRARAWRLNER